MNVHVIISIFDYNESISIFRNEEDAGKQYEEELRDFDVRGKKENETWEGYRGYVSDNGLDHVDRDSVTWWVDQEVL